MRHHAISHKPCSLQAPDIFLSAQTEHVILAEVYSEDLGLAAFTQYEACKVPHMAASIYTHSSSQLRVELQLLTHQPLMDT